METKTCTKCGETKTLTEFYYRKQDGYYTGACKECVRSANRRYHQSPRAKCLRAKRESERRDEILALKRKHYYENRERYKENTRRWRRENPQKHREQARRHWCRHKERRRAAKRERYRENQEAEIAASRRYRTENKERLVRRRKEHYRRNREAVLARNRARRARRASANGSATEEQIRARVAYFGGRCWMCGDTYEEIDHVKPLSKGGSHWPANLRPACKTCNSAKNDAWPLEDVIERMRVHRDAGVLLA